MEDAAATATQEPLRPGDQPEADALVLGQTAAPETTKPASRQTQYMIFRKVATANVAQSPGEAVALTEEFAFLGMIMHQNAKGALNDFAEDAAASGDLEPGHYKLVATPFNYWTEKPVEVTQPKPQITVG